MRKQYRTTKECATLTGVKTRTIRELCSDGYVDSKKQGNSVLVNLDSGQHLQSNYYLPVKHSLCQ